MTEPKPVGGPRLASALAFVAPLVLYTVTAARTVQGGDAAEFGLLGIQGGVAHPPGYPLYSLLARAFGLLPINPPFFRVSLASVVCGAAAVFVIYRVSWRLTQHVWASLGAALTFAVAPIQWRLAGIPEVFALHALLVALAMLCTIRLSQAAPERRTREAILLGLVGGLGAANHLTIVLCAPLFLGALIHCFRTDGARSGLKSAGGFFAAALIGLLPYLLLFTWAHANPEKAFIWGRTTTWQGFIDHLLRKEYGTFSLHADKAYESTFASTYVIRACRAIASDYAYVFFLAGLWGAVVIVQARKAAGFVLLACLFLAGVFFPALISFPENDVTIEVAERFFLLPLVLFAPFVAWGLASLLSRYASLRYLVPLVVLMGLAAGWPQASWRNDTILEQYVVAIAKSLPPESVVIGEGDNLFTAMEWRRLVLGVRPDVRYVDPFALRGGWYYERMRSELSDVPLPYDETEPHVADLGLLLSQHRPTFYVPWLLNDLKGKVTVDARGLLFRVTPPNMQPLSADAHQVLLDRDMAILGKALPEPTDAWSAETARGILTPWSQIIESYTAAGRTADAERAARRVEDVFPPRLLDRWTAEH